MKYAEFKAAYPALERAAWMMFCDAGGSEIGRDSYEEFTEECLKSVPQSDLEVSEAEMAQLETRRDDWTTALCGEYEEAKALCSDTLHRTLNAIFGE